MQLKNCRNTKKYTLFFSIFNTELSFLFCRISVIFRVKSAKAVKITDMDLIKRLGLIVGVFVLFLLIRTLVSPPVVYTGKTDSINNIHIWISGHSFHLKFRYSEKATKFLKKSPTLCWFFFKWWRPSWTAPYVEYDT